MSDSFKVQVADEYGTLVVSKGNEYVCEMVGQYKDNAELAHKFAAATEMYGTLTFLESYFTLASNEDARGVVAKVLAKARGE